MIVAVLAGEGKMPRLVIKGIHEAQKKVLLIAIEGVTSHDLVEEVDEVVWLHLTQIGKALKALESFGVKELVMAGRIKHNKIFSLSSLHMDWITIKEWFSLKDKRANNIFDAVEKIISSRGVEVVNSVKYMEKNLAKEGVLTKKKPPKKIENDISLGMTIAKEIGGLDIGQTVVVKSGSIVAVEAMEGTDQCLERAGNIAGEGCIVVKMSKPNQDMRFDVPVIGVNTIEKLHKIKALGIVIEAKKTILIDDNIIDVADQYGLFVLAKSL